MMTPEEMDCLAWNIAAKAENVRSHAPENLGLLLFLEALNARPGGFRSIGEDMVKLFPHRLNPAVATHLEKSWKGPVGDLGDIVREAHVSRIADDIRDFVGGWNCSPSGFSLTGFGAALIQYQKIYAARCEEAFTHTTTSRALFDTLDYALETRHDAPIVLAEGAPAIGKTTAASAWVEQHLGDARLISLKGINNKSTLFRTISEGLRLPVARSASGATAMQGRIEDFLRRTKILLVFDRAEHLFPKANRINSHPVLLDFLLTLQDSGVPIALITWGQIFGERLRAVQAGTSWAAEMFIGRIARYAALEAPSIDDCANVARKILPEACPDGIKLVSKVAVESKGFLQTVNDLASEARRIARRNGRTEPVWNDIKEATTQRIRSAGALLRMVGSPVRPAKPQSPETTPTPTPEPTLLPNRSHSADEIAQRGVSPRIAAPVLLTAK